MSLAAPEDPRQQAPDPDEPGSKPAWYRRRGTVVAAVVVAVVAVTVVSDLPVHDSRAADISAESTVMTQTNQDLGSCAYAVREAFTIWNGRQQGTLSDSNISMSAGLLSQDQVACSYADDSIYELSDIQIPGTAAGKKLTDLVGVATLWASSDGVLAIHSIETLISDPTNAGALASLATAERELASDRARAEADADAANRLLGTTLSRPDLPVTPSPTAAGT